MARTDPQLNFRIPAELKERLEAAATENKRTLTAELVARLERSFSAEAQEAAMLQATREAKNRGLVPWSGVSTRHWVAPSQSSKPPTNEIADKVAERVVRHLQAPIDAILAEGIDKVIQRFKLQSLDMSQRAIDEFKDAGFRYKRILTSDNSPCVKIIFPKQIPSNGNELLAKGIEEAERFWGERTTVWIEVEGPQVPKFIVDAIDQCIAFGVRIFLSDKHGTVSHGDLNKFDDDLIEKIDAAGEGIRWSDLEKKFVE